MGIPFALAFPTSFTQAMQAARLAAFGVKVSPPKFDWLSPHEMKSASIEVAEPLWFERSNDGWHASAAGAIEDEVAAFVRNVFELPSRDLQVTCPTSSFTTAAAVMAYEQQT